MKITYLLADDDLKTIILATQQPVEVKIRGRLQFAQTKHDLSVVMLDENSRQVDKMSFENFIKTV